MKPRLDNETAMAWLLTQRQLERILQLTGGPDRPPVPVRCVAVMRHVVDLGLDQLERQQATWAKTIWAKRDFTE